MGQKDKATTRYMKQNKVFADAFNFLLYNGRQVLKPEQLREVDSKEISISFGENKGTEQFIQRTRDVIKSAVAMKDQRSTYLILAVEGQSQDILSFVPDYRINLLTPSKIAEEDFEKFQSTLGKVLQFIKHSENKEELVKVVEGDFAFQNFGREEIDVLNSCVNAGLKLIKEEEDGNVCKAIRDLVEEAEGRGMEKGMEFILDKQTVWIKNLMRKMNWCAEEAMDFLEVPMEDRDMLIVRL